MSRAGPAGPGSSPGRGSPPRLGDAPGDAVLPSLLAVRPVGPDAVLADYPDTAAVLAVVAALDRDLPPHLVERVPAETTLLLRAEHPGDLPALLRHLRGLRPVDSSTADASGSHGEVRIPMTADGPDLADTAALLGTTPEALLAAHRDTVWVAAFGGFAPGFAYLLPEVGGRPGGPPWEVPRRAEPRDRVPPGSVALASRYCGVYPRSSPGGWQLIGRTDERLFDPEREPAALLAPGTRVRFEPQRPRAAARHRPARRPRTATGPDQAARAVLDVLTAGPSALVQDAGRPGRAAIGVAASGAFDHSALVAANLAVGNPPHAAALEILLGPVRLRAREAVVLAVAGAVGPLHVLRAEDAPPPPEEPAGNGTTDHPTGAGVLVPGPVLALDAGDVLTVGAAELGLRRLLAVRGGLAAHPVLGSASRDTLSGLGPEPLAAGDLLRAGSTRGLAAVEAPPAEPEAPHPSGDLEVPVVPGPRDDLLGEPALETLLATRWTVRSDSDRVGVRLDGSPLPVPTDLAGRASEPMVPGAIQVPPSGLPVVFGPDHPTTGGYPVIGVVTRAGLDLLAQAVPGTTLRIVRTGREGAVAGVSAPGR